MNMSPLVGIIGGSQGGQNQFTNPQTMGAPTFTATQQAGLMQNQGNFNRAATGMGGQSMFGNAQMGPSPQAPNGGMGNPNGTQMMNFGTNGTNSVNPNTSVSGLFNNFFGNMNNAGSPGSSGFFNNLNSGMSNLLNNYDQIQRNVVNQQYFDPQGIQSQLNKHMADAGLGASPLGASLQDLSANRYFNQANANIMNANSGLLGGLTTGFLGLMSPYAQADAQLGLYKGQHQFDWDNAAQAMKAQETMNLAQRQLASIMDRGTPIGPGGLGQPIIGSGSIGGNPIGSPSAQELPEYLKNMGKAAAEGGMGYNVPWGQPGANTGTTDMNQVNQDWANFFQNRQSAADLQGTQTGSILNGYSPPMDYGSDSFNIPWSGYGDY